MTEFLSKLDFSICVYAFTLVLDLYGVGIFVWWWIKRRGATLMFKCVTALFVGDAIERALHTYSRSVLLYGTTEHYMAIKNNPWLGAWTLISVVTTLVVVIYVTRRIFQRLKATENHPRRRTSDG